VKEADQFIMAHGHETHFHRSGQGEAVILLHGSGPGVSAYANWRGILPTLAQKWDVVAPDIAGFGRTAIKPDTDYDIKYWVAQLTAFMDALGLQSAHLVGNSFGGSLAVAMALSQSDRVKSLVLMGTPGGEFRLSEGLRAAWHYEPSMANMEQLLKIFPYDKSIVTPEMVQSRFEASAKPGAQEAFRKLVPRPSDDEAAVVKGFPAKLLSKIEQRALVLHGRDDKVVPLECGLVLHRSIPNSELHVFGHCGHWVQVEREAAFLKLVGQFLEEVRGVA
jgi:2-hydroxy-6-oxo-octa-2,4-dienoate hydrolase